MAHTHSHPQDDPPPSGWTLGRVAGALAIAGAVIAVVLILAPHLLPVFGTADALLATRVLSPLHFPAGIAGGINQALAAMPLIGSELAKGGLFSAVMAGIAGVGGVLTGNYFSRKHEESGKGGINWGGIMKWSGLAAGMLISLPTLLTGISHGAAFFAAKFGGYNAGMSMIAFLTQPGSIGFIDTSIGTFGLAGLATIAPHMLACGASIGSVVAGAGLDGVLKKKEGMELVQAPYVSPLVPPPELAALAPEPAFAARVSEAKPVKKLLSPNDPNNFVTPEEQRMVDDYNAAPAHRKIIMQKEFRDKGYDPDFSHVDGSMHLYKHAHTPEQHSNSRSSASM